MKFPRTMLKENDFKLELYTNFVNQFKDWYQSKVRIEKKVDQHVPRKKIYLPCWLIQKSNEKYNFQIQGVKQD